MKLISIILRLNFCLPLEMRGLEKGEFLLSLPFKLLLPFKILSSTLILSLVHVTQLCLSLGIVCVFCHCPCIYDCAKGPQHDDIPKKLVGKSILWIFIIFMLSCFVIPQSGSLPAQICSHNFEDFCLLKMYPFGDETWRMMGIGLCADPCSAVLHCQFQK